MDIEYIMGILVIVDKCKGCGGNRKPKPKNCKVPDKICDAASVFLSEIDEYLSKGDSNDK